MHKSHRKILIYVGIIFVTFCVSYTFLTNEKKHDLFTYVRNDENMRKNHNFNNNENDENFNFSTEDKTKNGEKVEAHSSINNKYDEKYLINTEGCRIKKYDPFDPSVSIYFKKLQSPFPSCHDKSFLKVDGNKIYPNIEEIERKFKIKNISCIYQPILRNPKNLSKVADFVVELGDFKVLEFNVSLEHEFIKVECSNEKEEKLFEDYLALVFLKPDVEKRCEVANEKYLSPDALNIIIMAIDSTSKLNYLRHFPVTNSFLQKSIKPFEFHGHTKVADNTFVNMVPMLTGHFVSHYRKTEEIQTTYYDDLHLVWKEFASIGYRTHFIEDTPGAGTFSYEKQGFRYPTTDYYLRPFAVMAEKTGNKWRTKRGAYCFGHTSETEFFYDYFEKFVKTMEKRPFFAFTFISRTTHSLLNTAGYADQPTYEILKKLVDSNTLNNSALIFFSDHGIRFGDILKTYIGKVEERMPFMFQYYPEWFLKKHENFRAALTTNQRRLTTPFDVHKTLQHLVALSSKNGEIDFRQKNPGFGQSLFTPISAKRTCEDAHISPHWCVCNDRIQYHKEDKSVIGAAHAIINLINNMTNSVSIKSTCKMHSLKNVIDAYASFSSLKVFNNKTETFIDFLITVQAIPSEAQFEGTVRQLNGKYEVIGDISRVNAYGNQSWCISDPFFEEILLLLILRRIILKLIA